LNAPIHFYRHGAAQCIAEHERHTRARRTPSHKAPIGVHDSKLGKHFSNLALDFPCFSQAGSSIIWFVYREA
jgi:hypothetical protein